METKELLKLLSDSKGVSGYETNTRDVVKEIFADYVDEIKIDALGSIIMKKNGSKENKVKLMLASHIDEIGLMVTGIEDGFLRFTSVGGVDQRILPSIEVTVHGKKDLSGVISSVPPHLSNVEDRKKSWNKKELFIDCGMNQNEITEIVRVGDVISFKSNAKILMNDRFSGKSMDNRAGIAVLYECAKELANLEHKCDVYFVATVQEEVGYCGAFTSTFDITPDVGIAVDVTHANAPELPDYKVIEMGKGPGIGVGPHVHPAVQDKLIEIAKDRTIPYQIEPSASAQGTDAFAMQTIKEGVATGLISVPLRYMHTPGELLDVKDIVKSGRLLAYFAQILDMKFLEDLKCC